MPRLFGIPPFAGFFSWKIFTRTIIPSLASDYIWMSESPLLENENKIAVRIAIRKKFTDVKLL
jgi:hypothetical protein